MTSELATLDCQELRDAFQQWHADHETLDAELSESLAALSAYQSHLDAWQQQLASEREELRLARQQLDEDRAALEKLRGETNAASAAELAAARAEVDTLRASLLSRDEALQKLDNRHAEVATELEQTAAREAALVAALDEHQQSHQRERAQWAEELQKVRALLESRLETANSPQNRIPLPISKEKSSPPSRPASGDKVGSPVLVSIAEQFGKLRQQRAIDRRVIKNSG